MNRGQNGCCRRRRLFVAGRFRVIAINEGAVQKYNARQPAVPAPFCEIHLVFFLGGQELDQRRRGKNCIFRQSLFRRAASSLSGCPSASGQPAALAKAPWRLGKRADAALYRCRRLHPRGILQLCSRADPLNDSDPNFFRRAFHRCSRNTSFKCQ